MRKTRWLTYRALIPISVTLTLLVLVACGGSAQPTSAPAAPAEVPQSQS